MNSRVSAWYLGPKPSCFIHMSNPTATAGQILVSLSLVKLHSKLIAFGSDVQINQVIAYPSGSVEKIRASNILIACIIKWLPYFFFSCLNLRRHNYLVMKAKEQQANIMWIPFHLFCFTLQGNIFYSREKTVPIGFLLRIYCDLGKTRMFPQIYLILQIQFTSINVEKQFSKLYFFFIIIIIQLDTLKVTKQIKND